MTRRVVVTGVGLVCALGIGTEESWKNLVAGCSGVHRITHFDTAEFDCKIAGEVKNFDPFQWIEKKELKKMGRFIQIALAGADAAVKHAHWTPEQSNLEEVKQYINGQEDHHRKMSFQDELRALLRKHEIEWDEKYVWD